MTSQEKLAAVPGLLEHVVWPIHVCQRETAGLPATLLKTMLSQQPTQMGFHDCGKKKTGCGDQHGILYFVVI